VLTEDRLVHLRALAGLARDRGQTLAQMSLAWLLRDPRVTTVLVGASSARQLRDSVGALGNLSFTEEELSEIDAHSRAAAL
jgi:L-glyceraldehyde 3-phosphate reductase